VQVTKYVCGPICALRIVIAHSLEEQKLYEIHHKVDGISRVIDLTFLEEICVNDKRVMRR
jgi:hypothetical protein